MILLTESTLAEWKQHLDDAMQRRYGIEKYTEAHTDEHWLDNYQDCDFEDAISDEVFLDDSYEEVREFIHCGICKMNVTREEFEQCRCDLK